MSVRPRGRPRQYEPELVLQAVLQTFWRRGYAATSMEDLCAASGLNKASLYAGFGDKASLYRQALAAYVDQAGAMLTSVLSLSGVGMRERLHQMVALTVAAYRDGRGCFLLTTAPLVAPDDEVVQQALLAALDAQTRVLTGFFARARQQGDVVCGVDDGVLAGMAASLLHTLSWRARAGQPESALLHWARGQIDGLLALAGADQPG